MRKLGRTAWFVLGASVGYVAGARAGRERYEQIVRQGRSAAGQLGITSAKDRIGGSVRGAATEVKDTATARSREVLDHASGVAADHIDSVAEHLGA